jgi:hypothetical protein
MQRFEGEPQAQLPTMLLKNDVYPVQISLRRLSYGVANISEYV